MLDGGCCLNIFFVWKTKEATSACRDTHGSVRTSMPEPEQWTAFSGGSVTWLLNLSPAVLPGYICMGEALILHKPTSDLQQTTASPHRIEVDVWPYRQPYPMSDHYTSEIWNNMAQGTVSTYNRYLIHSCIKNKLD